MYSIKKENDLPFIMKYHRANDMVLIKKFFPELSPIDDLVILLNEKDYILNKDRVKNLSYVRNGNPITEPCMKSIPTNDINPDYLKIIKDIKNENKNGVLILFNTNMDKIKMYEHYAGISLGVSLGNYIYIDAVGKGFDGREVLKGISCHERYIIPWNDLRNISISNFKCYRTYITNDADYKKSRIERINYLVSCDIDKNILEESIPLTYNEIEGFIWLDVLRNVIKVILKEEDFLRSYGYLEFNLSGHTEGRRFRPWQMVSDKRM